MSKTNHTSLLCQFMSKQIYITFLGQITSKPTPITAVSIYIKTNLTSLHCQFTLKQPRITALSIYIKQTYITVLCQFTSQQTQNHCSVNLYQQTYITVLCQFTSQQTQNHCYVNFSSIIRLIMSKETSLLFIFKLYSIQVLNTRVF